MDLRLAGKVAIVTGASKGIGLAITKALVEEGALVVAGARSVGGLDGLPGVTAVALDLASREGPAALVQRAVDLHGKVDILVNNVGAVRLRLGGFLGTPDEEFEWSMNMNFYSAVRATRAALNDMLKHGGGAVVSVASVNAFFEPDSGGRQSNGRRRRHGARARGRLDRALPPAASPRRRRSPPSWSCLPPSALATSPAATSSSTAA